MNMNEILANPRVQEILIGAAKDLYYMAVIVWLVAIMGIMIEISKEKPRRERFGDILGLATVIGGGWFILYEILGNNQAVWYVLSHTFT